MMKLFRLLFELLLISCFINSNLSQHKKVALSHITLLLPYTSHHRESPTRFKISSHGGESNGCVEWSVEPKQGVIDIIQRNTLRPYNDDECPSNTFNEAIIKAISPPENGRVSATITAIDPKSGYSAECEVFIDKVNKLQVATSTRLIYLGKYESISVNGFDDKGNKFTTLQGLPMIWSGIGRHLQIISFEEASLMLPDILSGNGNDFEYKQQLKKNKNPLPVKGIWTGQEDVQVIIDTNKNKAGFAHIGCISASASLFVVMQLQLVPRTLYAAKCCIAHFDLITTSHNELDLDAGNIKMNETGHGYSDYAALSTELYRHKINVPKEQYKFVLKKNQLHPLKMSIQQNGALSTTSVTESGKLMVEDKVTSHESVENSADARIYVVDAHSIYAEVVKYKQYRIRPNTYIQRRDETDWYLTYNEEYLVRLTLYDKHGNALCVRDVHASEFNTRKSMKYLMNLKSWRQKYICSMIEWSVNIIDHKHGNKELQSFEESEFAMIYDKKDNAFKIKPTKIKSFTLKFTAKGIKCANVEILASSMKKVHVTSPVFFQNTSTLFCPNCDNDHKLLALIPYTGHHNIHKVPVFFDGGSGRYRLEINDTNIAHLLNHDINIGQDRKVSVMHGNNLGHTFLFLIDYFNPDNFAYIDVEVELVKKWELTQNVVKEILINSFVEMSIMIRDKYNRRFSSLDGMKQVISTSSQKQRVSLEFIAPTINQLIEAQFNPTSTAKLQKTNNTQIIKELKSNIKGNVLQNLQKKKQRINCSDMDGKIMVRGVSSGYDEFVISLQRDISELKQNMDSKMFVSVYKKIKPLHKAVAIAININEPYTMHWEYGPLAWPIKEVIPVDNQFLHPLQINIPPISSANSMLKDENKDFGFRYNGKTLEFVCYEEFHSFIELTVSNRELDSLVYPVLCTVEIEVYCFPQFKFNSSKMEMGVGTRKNAKALYPVWVKSRNISSEFFIEIDQIQTDGERDRVVSVVNNDNLIAKRLGSSLITGKLQHPTQRVYIHESGFTDTLEIIVLFKGFTMEMPSYWMINGLDEIAHIEGLDGDHHILPFRHNFDDVFVEWSSEDANIIELLSILPAPNQHNMERNTDKKERNNVGTGLSVRLVAHSVGLVNIMATISLRNPPKSIKMKTQFQLTQTITVIPRAVYPCNSIILQANSSLPLAPIFNPDTNVAGIGQIYNIDHGYSHSDGFVYVSNKKLNVDSRAPAAENVAVTLILQSPLIRKPHVVKQYPLTQAASLIVSIVEPTGLNLLKTTVTNNPSENILYSYSYSQMDGNDNADSQPFWSYQNKVAVEQVKNANKYSKTENILCEKQNITLKIAILDELARELHVIDECKVVSNDTSIVLPRKDIFISSESIGGPMYANVYLDALQAGYATITFRHDQQKDSYQQQSAAANPYYVYDNPTFLRTFLTIRVLSTVQCEKEFGVIYQSDATQSVHSNQSVIKKTTIPPRPMKQQQQQQDNNNYKNGRNWQSSTVKSLPANSKSLIVIFCVLIFLLIVVCTWGNCWDIFGLRRNQNDNNANNMSSTMHAIGYDQSNIIPPAAFNPYASVNRTDNSFHQQSFNTSNSFYM